MLLLGLCVFMGGLVSSCGDDDELENGPKNAPEDVVNNTDTTNTTDLDTTVVNTDTTNTTDLDTTVVNTDTTTANDGVKYALESALVGNWLASSYIYRDSYLSVKFLADHTGSVYFSCYHSNYFSHQQADLNGSYYKDETVHSNFTFTWAVDAEDELVIYPKTCVREVSGSYIGNTPLDTTYAHGEAWKFRVELPSDTLYLDMNDEAYSRLNDALGKNSMFGEFARNE